MERLRLGACFAGARLLFGFVLLTVFLAAGATVSAGAAGGVRFTFCTCFFDAGVRDFLRGIAMVGRLIAGVLSVANGVYFTSK